MVNKNFRVSKDFSKDLAGCIVKHKFPENIFNTCLMESLRKYKKPITEKPKTIPEWQRKLNEKIERVRDETKIMKLFKENKILSIEDISRETNLEKERVKTIINDLIERKVLEPIKE